MTVRVSFFYMALFLEDDADTRATVSKVTVCASWWGGGIWVLVGQLGKSFLFIHQCSCLEQWTKQHINMYTFVKGNEMKKCKIQIKCINTWSDLILDNILSDESSWYQLDTNFLQLVAILVTEIWLFISLSDCMEQGSFNITSLYQIFNFWPKSFKSSVTFIWLFFNHLLCQAVQKLKIEAVL